MYFFVFVLCVSSVKQRAGASLLLLFVVNYLAASFLNYLLYIAAASRDERSTTTSPPSCYEPGWRAVCRRLKFNSSVYQFRIAQCNLPACILEQR